MHPDGIFFWHAALAFVDHFVLLPTASFRNAAHIQAIVVFDLIEIDAFAFTGSWPRAVPALILVWLSADVTKRKNSFAASTFCAPEAMWNVSVGASSA